MLVTKQTISFFNPACADIINKKNKNKMQEKLIHYGIMLSVVIAGVLAANQIQSKMNAAKLVG
jgi:predicted nucleic acid-binding Zn ribbon protein